MAQKIISTYTLTTLILPYVPYSGAETIAQRASITEDRLRTWYAQSVAAGVERDGLLVTGVKSTRKVSTVTSVASVDGVVSAYIALGKAIQGLAEKGLHVKSLFTPPQWTVDLIERAEKGMLNLPPVAPVAPDEEEEEV
jgi:hypothetical protein